MKSMMTRVLASIVCSLIALPVHADVADNIRNQLKSNDAQGAFEQGRKNEAENAGNEKFDAAYAAAAIKTNNCSVAVFALERILIQNPLNHTARLQQANCYVSDKNYQLAKSTLKIIIESQAPPQITEAAKALMQSAIDAEKAQQSTKFSLSLKGGIGYSTNPALLPGTEIFSVLAKLPKRKAAVKTAFGDGFNTLGLNLNLKNKLANYANNRLSLTSNMRKYWSSTKYDTIYLSLNDTLEFKENIVTIGIPLSAAITFLNYKPAIVTADLGAEIGVQIIPEFATKLITGINRTWFTSQKVSNMDYFKWLGALEFNAKIPAASLSFTAQGFYKYAFLLPETRPHLAKNSSGIQFSTQFTGLKGHTPNAMLLVESWRFKNVHPKYGLARNDLALSVQFNWPWKFYDALTITPAYSLTMLRANIAENTFERHDVSLSLTYAPSF